MENYFEQFERFLRPHWTAAQIREWWETPITTLGGRRTPHQLCLSGLSTELMDDVRAQIRAASDPRQIIRDCQAIIARHLPPDGPSAKDTITDLLEILDGPRARAALCGDRKLTPRKPNACRCCERKAAPGRDYCTECSRKGGECKHCGGLALDRALARANPKQRDMFKS